MTLLPKSSGQEAFLAVAREWETHVAARRYEDAWNLTFHPPGDQYTPQFLSHMLFNFYGTSEYGLQQMGQNQQAGFAPEADLASLKRIVHLFEAGDGDDPDLTRTLRERMPNAKGFVYYQLHIPNAYTKPVAVFFILEGNEQYALQLERVAVR